MEVPKGTFFMSKNSERIAVIVAGGSGSRMGSAIPKQFLPIRQIPIIVRTLQAFLDFGVEQIALVLPEAELNYWKENIAKTYFTEEVLKKIGVVKGGKTRYQSVSNGLHSFKENGQLVAIHDGVRPFVHPEMLEEGYATALKFGTAIPVVDSKDSVRILQEDGTTKHQDRSTIKLVQTPQIFQLKLIQKAFEKGEQAHFTDDASVAEFAGFTIHTYSGSYKNLKITSPEDLIIAESFLSHESGNRF